VARRSKQPGRRLGERCAVQPGTPTFFLGIQNSDKQGAHVLNIIRGAQLFSEFKKVIERS
jgi:hypothetical protein